MKHIVDVSDMAFTGVGDEDARKVYASFNGGFKVAPMVQLFIEELLMVFK